MLEQTGYRLALIALVLIVVLPTLHLMFKGLQRLDPEDTPPVTAMQRANDASWVRRIVMAQFWILPGVGLATLVGLVVNRHAVTLGIGMYVVLNLVGTASTLHEGELGPRARLAVKLGFALMLPFGVLAAVANGV